MIPSRFTLNDMQESFRSVQQRLEALDSRNVDMGQRRITNAGQSISPFDYVTQKELRDAMVWTTPSTVDATAPTTGLLNIETPARAGTFATRGPALQHQGELFYATDHHYVGWFSTGAAWVYVSGENTTTQAGIAAIAALLGSSDVDYKLNVSDFTHRLRWTGSAWDFAPGDPGSAFIVWSPIAPVGGTWGVCDGSTYTYLKADGTTGSQATQDDSALRIYDYSGYFRR